MITHAAILFVPGILTLITVFLVFLPKLHQQKLDHEYRMAQLRETVDQNNHKRYLELEASGKETPELELQARATEAEARKTEAQVKLAQAENELARLENRRYR